MKNLTNILSSSESILSNNTIIASIKTMNAAHTSLSAVIKSLKSDEDAWSCFEQIFAMCSDTVEKSKVTPAMIIKLVPACLKNEKGEICTIRRVYESERVQVYRDGLPVLRDGKPLEKNIRKVDTEGNEIVKDIKLFPIKNWSVKTLVTLIAQASAASE